LRDDGFLDFYSRGPDVSEITAIISAQSQFNITRRGRGSPDAVAVSR